MTGGLGPLDKLEPHLPGDWWRRLFGEWYLRTDGDVVENDANTRDDVDMAIAALALAPAERVLDLCCGQGRHALELWRRGHVHVCGLDASPYLIGLARERAAAAGAPVAFVEGEADALPWPDASFDAVLLMGNSFGYHQDAGYDRAVLRAVRRVLAPGGRVLLDLTDGDWMRAHFEPRSWEWLGPQHLVCRERQLGNGTEASEREHRLVCREIIIDTTRGVLVDQLYAERLYALAEIRALLADEGFTDVALHGQPGSLSERNQDLGMMAARMVVTGRVVGRGLQEVVDLDVAVLLGDPQLPDEVKRGGRTNPEDLEVVARLEAALATVPGYRFRVLSRHDALLATLREARPDMVLNLCDEGFRNQAGLEAHVPALLELLDLPYTGAGPACLAMCHDKRLVRALARELGIPVPEETYRAPGQAVKAPTYPAIVKPNMGDGSFGIPVDAVVADEAALAAWLKTFDARYPGRAAVIQTFLPGTEVTVGIVGDRVLPILQPDFGTLAPPILGYESKYEPDSPYWSIPFHEARLDPATHDQLVRWSRLLCERLDCRDYARFDFRADARGRPHLLEVNPNPAWCWDGKLAQMAALAGLGYADMLAAILQAARARLATTAINRPTPGTL